MKTFTIAILTVLLFAIKAAYIHSKPLLPMRVQACGSELADLLSNTCRWGYNTYDLADVDENSSDSTGKRNIRKRGTIGIIQECCLNACSLADIMNYCHDGSNVKSAPTEFVADVTEATSTETKPCIDKTKTLVNNEIVIRERPSDICDNGRPGVKTTTAKVKQFDTLANSTPMPNDVVTQINVSGGESNQSKTLRPYYTKPPFIIAMNKRFKLGESSYTSNPHPN